MKINTFWSARPETKQDKARTFETDKGFLLTSVTDSTDDAAFERFEHLMIEHADIFDKCNSQKEVYQYTKLIDKLAKQAGVIDT